MINNQFQIHKYLSLQSIWDKLDSQEQGQLFILSEIIWENSSQDDRHLDPEILMMLSSKNEVLDRNNELWQFKLPEMIYFSYSLFLIDIENFESLPALEVLESLSNKLRIQTTHPNHEMNVVVAFVIAHLINRYKRCDLLRKIISEEMSDITFWSFTRILQQVIPILEVDVKFYCQFLTSLSIKMKSDLSSAFIYSATNKLGQLRPEYAIKIVESFAEDSVPEAGVYLEQIMTGIANSSENRLSEIVERCIEWIDSQEEILIQSSILCLQNLVIDEKFDQDRFINLCFSLKDSQQEGVLFTLSSVLTRIGGKLLRLESQCFEILSELVNIGPPEGIKYSIANVLSTSEETKFKISCLSFLTDVSTDHKGTIGKISWSLFPLAKTHPIEVWNFLEKWVKNHNLDVSITKYHMFLTPILETYQESKKICEKVVTRWFSSPNLNLVEESRRTITELNIFSFSSSEIENMPAHTIKYITEKLLVGGFSSDQLINLFYSIIRNTEEINDLEEYFSSVLSYLTWNYPSSSIEFFEKILAENDETEVNKIINKAKKELMQYQEERKQISALFHTELAPSEERRREFLAFQNKLFQQSSQKAMSSDRFPLQKMMKKISIGRGSRFYHMILDHQDLSQKRIFSEPTSFAHFSDSFELPRGYDINPEREAWLRINRQNILPEDIK